MCIVCIFATATMYDSPTISISLLCSRQFSPKTESNVYSQVSCAAEHFLYGAKGGVVGEMGVEKGRKGQVRGGSKCSYREPSPKENLTMKL